MPKYLLDTNMVTHILRENPNVLQRIEKLHFSELGISILTHAEIQYGFAKKPEKTKMQRLFNQLALRIEILPFNEMVSNHYGQFKVSVEKQGKSLAPLDMLIAAHADAVGAILVSNDVAFTKITHLRVEDWTQNIS